MALARILAFSLLAAVPSMTFAAPASAATPEASAAAELSIKATVEHEGAKVAATASSAVGKTTTLRAADEKHAHDLSVTIVSKTDKGYALELGYKRDGKRIVKAKTLQASGGALTVDAGGSTITLTLAPAKPKRSRIEMPDGDDPLAGL